MARDHTRVMQVFITELECWGNSAKSTRGALQTVAMRLRLVALR